MLPPFAPADLNAPGWSTRRAQAVWQPDAKKPEITGELLISTNAQGALFVQLSKNPFTIVTAQRRAGNWQLEYGPEGKRYSGTGDGPPRIIWLRLPAILAGDNPPLGWVIEQRAADVLQMAHPGRGESLHVVFE